MAIRNQYWLTVFRVVFHMLLSFSILRFWIGRNCQRVVTLADSGFSVNCCNSDFFLKRT